LQRRIAKQIQYLLYFSILLHCIASRQTHTKGDNKNNEGKQRKKYKWKHAECDHVKKRQKKSSETESFKHMKISYTPEDSHVGRNM
jgi:hypothetical protein